MGGDLNTGLDILGTNECLELLRSQRLGRLGVIVETKPEIFPVYFSVDDDGSILFRTGPGTKLAGALAGPVVFEVDHLDSATGTGWSVVIHGRAHGLAGSASLAAASRLQALGDVTPIGSHRPHVLSLTPAVISGRRIKVTPLQAGAGALTSRN